MGRIGIGMDENQEGIEILVPGFHACMVILI